MTRLNLRLTVTVCGHSDCQVSRLLLLLLVLLLRLKFLTYFSISVPKQCCASVTNAKDRFYATHKTCQLLLLLLLRLQQKRKLIKRADRPDRQATTTAAIKQQQQYKMIILD